MASHKNKARTVKTKFYNAIRKYGWASFNYEVISKVQADSYEQLTTILDNLEILYIEQYNSYHLGYNSTLGGHSKRGYNLSEEYKKYCLNRTYSEETRLKMSNSARNKVVSLETRDKLSKSAKSRKFSKYREIYSERRLANLRKARCKKVLQLTEEGLVIRVFPSIKEATLYIVSELAPHLTYYGVENAVIRHCKGKTKKKLYYGFVWKYGANV